MVNASIDDTVRCFAAIPVDAPVLDAIRKTQHLLQKRCPSTGLKWIPPGQIHLTVRFYGNVASANIDELKAALIQACQGMRPFDLTAQNIGCFPAWEKPRVLWTGLAGNLEALQALQHRLNSRTHDFGDNDEQQEFKPHLTVARIKTQSSREMREIGEALRNAAIGTLGCWKVTQVLLIQSRLTPQGPIYENLAAAELTPG